MLRRLAAAVLALHAAQADPRLPSLPDQFDTWVTCNIVNKNYSVVVHEVFDAPNQRALLSRFHGAESQRDNDEGLSRTLYLYDLGEYFHVNATHCTGDLLINNRFGMVSRGGRTPTSNEMLDFAREGQVEEYMGTEIVNGVPCNHWQSVVPMGPGGSMTLDYFFSVSGWASPESNATEIPVLLHLTGSRPVHSRPGEMHTFDHYYSFNHFRVGPIADWSEHEFYVSGETTCVGNFSKQPNWEVISRHAKFCETNCGDIPSQGGVYFGFVVLGAVCQSILLMICSFFCGQKYGQRFKPMLNEMPVTNSLQNKSGMEISAPSDRPRTTAPSEHSRGIV
mmetsp:Transcript_2642/g.3999  ORF Transcript_2642/g.3999 Transcript_2642/m.3999 type:complete len:336 (+) Transcript_2642:37-1044(+)